MSQTKKTIPYFRLISNGDISGNILSNESDINMMDRVKYIVEWTGSSPVGVLNVEYLKVGKSQSASGVDEWGKIDFGGVTLTDIPISGSSGSHEININTNEFSKLRIRYTRTSGSGTLNVYMFAKEG